ncbi:MAG: hypothetical protein KC636_37470 [Myxococcales bacterium]|nr:hypothetical protein [Myxococcales bacterium]
MALLAVGCTELPRTYSSESADAVPIFRDDFERDELGPAWRVTGEGARIERGALFVEGLKNHPLWLTQALPDDVRIEFDAYTPSEEGDIKIELAGDGASAAKTANYTATGYVILFGGWNNTVNAIVRRNEHGRDKEAVDKPQVEPGRRYHFVITREGGAIRWSLDGAELLLYEDPRPLVGEGHQHFAFSGWESPVYFDNLVISSI